MNPVIEYIIYAQVFHLDYIIGIEEERLKHVMRRLDRVAPAIISWIHCEEQGTEDFFGETSCQFFQFCLGFIWNGLACRD